MRGPLILFLALLSSQAVKLQQPAGEKLDDILGSMNQVFENLQVLMDDETIA